MKKYLKFSCFVLAAAQLIFLLIACKPQSSGDNQTGSESDSSLPLLETGLPERDCNGYNFRILIPGIEGDIYVQRRVNSFVAEEDSSERVAESVYRRRADLYERYNFNTKVVLEAVESIADSYGAWISSGDDVFDVGMGQCNNFNEVVLGGYTMPWEQLEYVDLSQSWWNQTAVESLKVSDYTYYVVGDFCYDVMDYAYLIYFNKDLCRDLKIDVDALYETALDGDWTLAKLYSTTKDIYSDLNNNGYQDLEDLYGFTSNVYNVQSVFQSATATPTVEKDEDNIPVLIDDISRLTTLVERMYTIMYDSKGTFPVNSFSFSTDAGIKYFWDMTSFKMSNRTSVFATGLFYERFLKEYYTIDFDLGFLPMPKFNSNQRRYQTTIDHGGLLATVPKSANTDLAGFCAEALAAYGKEYVTPEYKETALKTRYAANIEQDGKMVDLIVDGIVFDLYSIYTFSTPLQTMIEEGRYNISSHWAANGQFMGAKIDNIVNKLLENAEG